MGMMFRGVRQMGNLMPGGQPSPGMDPNGLSNGAAPQPSIFSGLPAGVLAAAPDPTLSTAAAGLPAMNMPQLHRTFLGQGGWGRDLAGKLGEAGMFLSASAGNPAALAMLEGRQRQQQEQTQNMAEAQRQLMLASFNASHREPTAIQRNHDYFMQLGRPDLAESYLSASANPQTLMTDPTTGSVGFYPKGGLPGMNYGAPPSASGSGGDIPSVTDDPAGHAAYAALPKGAQFRTPDGAIRTKG